MTEQQMLEELMETAIRKGWKWYFTLAEKGYLWDHDFARKLGYYEVLGQAVYSENPIEFIYNYVKNHDR